MPNKQEVTEKLTALGIAFDPNTHFFTLSKLLRDAEANIPPAPTGDTPPPEKIDLPKFVPPADEPAQPPIEDLKQPEPVNTTVAALRANAAAVIVARAPTWKNIKTGKAQQRYHELERPNNSIDIKTDDGTFVRNYSLEVHGKNYAQLARQLCEKKNSQIT